MTYDVARTGAAKPRSGRPGRPIGTWLAISSYAFGHDVSGNLGVDQAAIHRVHANAALGVEVSCTAGVTDDGKWIRLFPLPYRLLDDENKFKKYQWINVNLTKARNDPRPESYNPQVDQIETGSILSAERLWAARWNVLRPLVKRPPTEAALLLPWRDIFLLDSFRQLYPVVGKVLPRCCIELGPGLISICAASVRPFTAFVRQCFAHSMRAKSAVSVRANSATRSCAGPSHPVGLFAGVHPASLNPGEEFRRRFVMRCSIPRGRRER
jgi:hypothetical protein